MTVKPAGCLSLAAQWVSLGSSNGSRPRAWLPSSYHAHSAPRPNTSLEHLQIPGILVQRIIVRLSGVIGRSAVNRRSRRLGRSSNHDSQMK